MADLNVLKTTRKVTRGAATKLITSATTELNAAKIDQLKIVKIRANLEVKEQSLNQLNADISKLIIDEEEREKDIETAIEYQEKIIDSITELNFKMAEISGRGSASTSLNTSQSSNGHHQDAVIKLPKIEMKKYSGDPIKWNDFWSHFELSVEKNTSLTEKAKFIYLKSMLEGAAANVVQGLEINDANYKDAVSLLEARFRQKEIIINAHIQALMKMTPVKRTSDVAGLRKLYDAIELHLRSLTNMKVDTNTLNIVLCPMLKAAVPDVVAMDFQRANKTQPNDMKLFLDFLREELSLREQNKAMNEQQGNQTPDKVTPTRTNNEFKKNWKERTIPSATALLNKAAECLFCDEIDHQQENCKISLELKKKMCMKKGRCFRCLEKGHLSRHCTIKDKCTICERNHHTLMCDGKGKEEKILISSVSEITNDLFFQVVMVNVESEKMTKPAQCFFDGGSHRSFITEKLSRELGAEIIGEQIMNFVAFGERTAKPTMRNRVKVTLRDTITPENSYELEAIEVPYITGSVARRTKTNVNELLKSNDIKLNLDQAQVRGDEVSILIGTDHFWRIVTGKIKRLDEKLMCLDTLFGWTIHGAAEDPNENSTVVKVNSMRYEEKLDQTLKKFWELEAIGIKHESATDLQDENDQAMESFENSIKWNGERYEVRLPWLVAKNELADNYHIALRRFWNLLNKFKQDPELFRKYKEVIDNQLRDGIVEEAPENCDNENCYYLPHQPIIKENRTTTKLRIVFDASSHGYNALSLNDCLFTGPNLMPNLIDVVLIFRMEIIAYISDIKQAFHQILLYTQDRDSVRFFWIQCDWDGKGPAKLRILRQTRVLFGAAPSPFLLNATIAHHLKKFEEQFPETVRRALKRFYVDDFVDSIRTEKEAEITYKEMSLMMQSANMELVKWNSNSALMKQKFANDYPDCEILDIQKVLGLVWNTIEDCLSLELEEILKMPSSLRVTKRQIAQLVAKIFDPLGMAGPFTVTGKLIFQELWRQNIKWDEQVPNTIFTRWKEWRTQIVDLTELSIPRHCWGEEENGRREIHFFCDASPLAYGVVAYSRTIAKLKIETRFILSKSRVAPLKTITLPRLELMGALLLSRLIGQIPKMEGTRVVCWTDSTIVLHWLNGKRKRTIPFVTNRVEEINKNAQTCEWRHCPGKENPADLLTRGIEAKTMINCEEWWKGPMWLRRQEDEWPDVKLESEEDEIEEDEIDTVSAIIVTKEKLECIFDPASYGTWKKTLRVTARVKRFIRNLKMKVRDGSSLTMDEIHQAKVYWVGAIQREYFENEIEVTKKNLKIPRGSALEKITCQVDDDGLLQVETRLRWSSRKELRNPWILSAKHVLFNVIVREAHERNFHGGLGDTLSEIRQHYWAPQMRRNVKSTINSCFTCKRVQGRLLQQQESALPSDRIEQSEPFEVVGVDYAGPLYQKDGTKCYVAVFTCAVVRAVHLELVSAMTTENFILTLKRFIARRGVPRIIYSDNTRTFKRAERELRMLTEGQKGDRLQNYLSEKGIEWKFIAERAPWWGGFWERMVKTTKISLKKVLGRSSLGFEELPTVLAEIEATINSRPLSYVYTDTNEQEPLTPASFLIGKRLVALPDPSTRPEANPNSSKTEILKTWKLRQNLIGHFWKRWHHEYLTELRVFSGVKQKRNLQVNDVVLVEEQNQPRLAWKLGQVREIFMGRDGLVRACEVGLPFGKSVRRPVQRLCLLEAHDGSE